MGCPGAGADAGSMLIGRLSDLDQCFPTVLYAPERMIGRLRTVHIAVCLEVRRRLFQ